MAGEKAILEVLRGNTVFPPPVWMMRQAGRYLPEYRETRTKAGSFLDLCYAPELACEVTLQPIRRFDFDAAILFSDILVVPHALGRDLRFEEGVGPRMTPIAVQEIEELDGSELHERLAPVYEAIGLIRSKLDDGKALLGFCGAPWTVATYMIAGKGSPDQAATRLFGFREPVTFALLLDRLADVSADYLSRQIDAGVDAVQIFDSWSGVLDEAAFDAWCVKPVARLVRRLREKHPDVPVIGFPRGAGLLYDEYRQKTGVTGLGLDWSVPLKQARRLQEDGAVQGNLDPQRLVAGGDALREGVDKVLETLGNGPLIFNLGHGITPDAPIDHVEAMVGQLRNAVR